MATPLFSFTTLNGSDPAGHDSINVLIKSIEDQLNSISSGLYAGKALTATTGQVLRWSGTTYANALVNAASLDTGAVIEAKIASGAVTETKIADSAVTSAKIANDTIVNADINSAAAIVDTKLATISTAAKVSRSAIDTSGSAAGQVLTSTGSSATPAWQSISSGSVTLAGDITGAANANSIATGAVTSAKILDGTIVAGDISSTYPGHQVVTTTQKNALTGVTTGTMVYDSTLGLVQMWNGTVWTAVPQPRIGAKVHLTANASASATVSWNAAQYDTDPAGAMWSAGDPTKVTIQTAGLWQLSFNGAWQATSGVVAPQIRMIRSGGFDVANSYESSPSPTFGYFAIHVTMACVVGDYFQCVAQLGGTGGVVGGTANEQSTRTTFTATRLSA